MSRDVTTKHAESEPRSEAVAFVLAVVAGPSAGASLRIAGTEAGTVLVGQSPACHLRVDDPLVSRRHVAFEHAGAFLRVRDLGSTNGTYVDRVRVVEAELSGGELVRLGETVVRVECEDLSEQAPLPSADRFGRMLGASPEMRRIYPLCERLAASSVPVILEGETGTGKEVLAEALHEAGPRAGKPFVVFDCTTVPANLLEAELFGFERGAFTGALASRRGVFEQAHGGTLFIDEIGDLDLALQPKLLRAIERLEVRRVGSEKVLRFDVRVLAATRRNLDCEVQEGRFRDDLFHRLAVARVELPPLRHRRGDVALLVDAFWRELGGPPEGPSAEQRGRWMSYGWPGNVRELRNAIARAIAIGDLPAFAAGGASSAASQDRETVDGWVRSGLPYLRARDDLLELFTERFIEHAMEAHGGDSAKAALASGIGRRYLQKLRAKAKK